jgi:hypothetical protein
MTDQDKLERIENELSRIKQDTPLVMQMPVVASVLTAVKCILDKREDWDAYADELADSVT